MRIRHIASKLGRKFVYPFLPKRGRLPFNYWLHLLGGSIEPELRHLRSICKEGGVAIDIGANIGLYSYRMARIFSKVYAFEINEDVTEDIVAYHSKNIEVIHSGLSSKAAEMTLHIPSLKGLVLHGWASLQAGNCPDTSTHVTKAVNVRPLDSFSLRDVTFIKIDVEGHEIEVLRGGTKTIADSRPVVLVEVKDENLRQVSSFFAALNYEEISLQKICGVEGSRENRIYRPCA